MPTYRKGAHTKKASVYIVKVSKFFFYLKAERKKINSYFLLQQQELGSLALSGNS